MSRTKAIIRRLARTTGLTVLFSLGLASVAVAGYTWS
jgi:hypothetical protein